MTSWILRQTDKNIVWESVSPIWVLSFMFRHYWEIVYWYTIISLALIYVHVFFKMLVPRRGERTKVSVYISIFKRLSYFP